MNLNEILITLRKENNLTQKALSKKLDIGQATICQWENGATQPNFDAITKLCNFYDITADFLMGLTDENGCVVGKYRNITPQKQLFLDIFDKMSINQKELLFDVMREFIG